MNKASKLVCFLLVTCMLISGMPVYADTMELNCKSAILVEASTGKVVYEKNAHEKLPPASVTKVMTMLLIMEAIDSGKITLDDKVTISKQSESKNTEGTRLLLEAGEVRTVKELLYGIAVESANDACLAMAEYLSGSEEEFAKLMNQRAKELGCNDTNFVSSNGLHKDGHVTSAYDIAVMSRELLKHKDIFEFISKYSITINVGKKNNVKRELFNKNKLLTYYKDIDGIKTGFTNEAMFCISLTGKRNNLRFISVIMGAPSTQIRNRDARKLLDYGFANYSSYLVAKGGEVIKGIKVTKGEADKVNLVVKDDITMLLMKGEEKAVKKVINAPDKIMAPVKKGQKLGEIIVYKDNKEIGKYAILADKDIGRATMMKNLTKAFQYWFGPKDR